MSGMSRDGDRCPEKVSTRSLVMTDNATEHTASGQVHGIEVENGVVAHIGEEHQKQCPGTVGGDVADTLACPE